jgi:hypothetical protein
MGNQSRQAEGAVFDSLPTLQVQRMLARMGDKRAAALSKLRQAREAWQRQKRLDTLPSSGSTNSMSSKLGILSPQPIASPGPKLEVLQGGPKLGDKRVSFGFTAEAQG